MTDFVLFLFGVAVAVWCVGLTTYAVWADSTQRIASLANFVAALGILVAEAGERARNRPLT